jgi:hypothetical protein
MFVAVELQLPLPTMENEQRRTYDKGREQKMM